MSPSVDPRRLRRQSARAALYLALATTAAATALVLSWIDTELTFGRESSWADTDFESLAVVQLLREYVAIDTSLPAGDPAAGAEFLAARLAAAGVPATIERLAEREANLWAILEGDDPEAVVLHHHLDVEPVPDPAAWRLPPFAGEIEGPWIYGRGTFDMKSVAVAQLEAFTRLARSGRRPSRSVVLLATSGEETGSHLGMRWVLARHPELVSRFGLFLTEGGAVEGRSPDDVKYWGTEFAQKRLVEVTLCGGDRAALEAIRRELLGERQRADRLEVTPEVERFLAHYAPTRDHSGMRRLLGDPRAFIRDAAAYHGYTAYLRAMFRDEVAPHQVAEAPGGGFELKVYVTLLPGRETADAVADFFPPGRLHGLAAAVYDDGAAHHGSPPDHPVFADVEAAIHARYPGVPTGPLFLPWTLTDARFVRNHDVPAYGFSPFMVLTPEVVKLSQFAKVDERIALPGFVEGVEVYGDLLERLTD